MHPSLTNINNKISLFLFFALSIVFQSCFNFDLFPEETVVYKGRIVEAFDTTKPVDNVLVQGCTHQFSLFPSSPACNTETFTDVNGDFYISFKADRLEGRGISYGKEGYSSLDSCKKLSNGTLECYIKPLPTVFYIFSPTKDDVAFVYDSLVVQVHTETKDTTVHYVTGSYLNSFGRTVFYWTSDSNSDRPWEKSYTVIKVLDNSSVTIEASYFKDGNEEKVDNAAIFCPKGIGTSYKIHDN